LEEYCGSKYFRAILALIGKENHRDALHVDSAFKSGCRAFITQDSHILDNAKELEKLLGIRFFHTRDWQAVEAFAREERDG
jgi:hypothetical protein